LHAQVWKRKEANKLAVNLGARSAEWQIGNVAAPHDRRRARAIGKMGTRLQSASSWRQMRAAQANCANDPLLPALTQYITLSTDAPPLYT
jgi:hypothetical protein